ncbi:MAG: secondary thiamine-phosphate synthase enzyme YjbQ [candidate division Zixibacteria bacterium]|nr:secondary thiamine-phosphate synthase enzyme YjbQ [candidate division Zixibacteria bacterium]
MIEQFTLSTSSRNQLIDVTDIVSDYVQRSGVKSGICLVYTPHTTAAITVNENADPSVKSDIIRKLTDIFPQNDNYDHSEGNSDAHLKSSVVGCSQTLLIKNGSLLLGTWQGIYFCEFDGPRRRQYFVKVLPG